MILASRLAAAFFVLAPRILAPHVERPPVPGAVARIQHRERSFASSALRHSRRFGESRSLLGKRRGELPFNDQPVFPGVRATFISHDTIAK
jgi:hypothetical protein